MRLTFLPNKRSIKKSWDVDADTDDADWGYIKPGFSCWRWKLEWEANSKEPFNGNSNSHENTARHTNEGKGVNQKRKENNEDIFLQIKPPENIFNASEKNEKNIKAGKSM